MPGAKVTPRDGFAHADLGLFGVGLWIRLSFRSFLNLTIALSLSQMRTRQVLGFQCLKMPRMYRKAVVHDGRMCPGLVSELNGVTGAWPLRQGNGASIARQLVVVVNWPSTRHITALSTTESQATKTS